MLYNVGLYHFETSYWHILANNHDVMLYDVGNTDNQWINDGEMMIDNNGLLVVDDWLMIHTGVR